MEQTQVIARDAALTAAVSTFFPSFATPDKMLALQLAVGAGYSGIPSETVFLLIGKESAEKDFLNQLIFETSGNHSIRASDWVLYPQRAQKRYEKELSSLNGKSLVFFKDFKEGNKLNSQTAMMLASQVVSKPFKNLTAYIPAGVEPELDGGSQKKWKRASHAFTFMDNTRPPHLRGEPLELNMSEELREVFLAWALEGAMLWTQLDGRVDFKRL